MAAPVLTPPASLNPTPAPAGDAGVAKQVLDTLAAMQTKQDALETQIKSLNEGNNRQRSQGPYIRTGEDINTSRGFSYVKLFGVLSHQLPADYAKVECMLVDKIKQSSDKLGHQRAMTNSVMVPFSSDCLATTHNDPNLVAEVRDTVRAGIQGYDPEQVAALRCKHWGREKALSWIDETVGATLVAPPQQGELIEVLRNNEIFLQAGARTLGMPPNGRIIWPRQTGAATAYWVGESQAITDSTQATGDVILQAKKLGVLCKIPNELFRFASVSVEQFVREDMARVLALAMDKAFLDNVGSTLTPKGLINYTNIAHFTATGVVAADGNTFGVNDVANMIGTVEEQNAIFKAFIMRPLMYTALSTRRADVYDGVTTSATGPFLFNTWRNLQEQYIDPSRMGVGSLNGYPVYKSTQVSNTRVKGNGANLTYILGGDFSEYLIAMSGAMEFQLSNTGDTPLTNDQTWFRGILYCDGAPRHEASFVVCDQLLVA